MGKISIFTLGHTGVVIDPNSLEPTVPQDALAIAQNAGPDPRQGRGGAIRKRPGLARFNILWAGGVILGGIPVPVAEYGGAPTSGGGAFPGTGDGDDGTSTGTGDGTGAPGGTSTGGPITSDPPGAGTFTGGSPIFGGVRLIVVAKSTVGLASGGVGWFVGPRGLTANAQLVATPAQSSVYAYPPTATFTYPFGLPGCVDNIGTTGLYYAGNTGDQIVGFTTLPVYRTDGGTNVQIATVPRSTRAEATITGGAPAVTAIRNAIINMHYGSDGFIYICVKDKYNGQNTAGSCGRVFRLTPSTGAIVEWNMGSTPGAAELFAHLPYCSCYFDGKLYVGTFPDAIDESAQVWATTGSSATQETAFTGPGGHNYGYLASMCVYNGRLFVGTGEWATVPQLCQVWSRRPGDLTGAWSSQLTQSTGVAASGSSFLSMIVFQGSLYVSFIGSVGTIYKITANNPGDPTSTSFTTSVVLTGLIYAPLLWVDDGIMYAISTGDDAGATPVQITTDGTTWTDKAGTLPATGGVHARGIFFGLDQ